MAGYIWLHHSPSVHRVNTLLIGIYIGIPFTAQKSPEKIVVFCTYLWKKQIKCVPAATASHRQLRYWQLLQAGTHPSARQWFLQCLQEFSRIRTRTCSIQLEHGIKSSVGELRYGDNSTQFYNPGFEYKITPKMHLSVSLYLSPFWAKQKMRGWMGVRDHLIFRITWYPGKDSSNVYRFIHILS